MRKTLLLISSILIATACNENSKKEKSEKISQRTSTQTIDVKKETQKLFDSYAPEIEKSNGYVIDNSKLLIGDLNDDGHEDALVFFVLTPVGGGNMIMGTQMAVYLNRGDKMEVVAGYDPQKIFKPIEIMNNEIHLIEYEYANEDAPNRPSIENHKCLILNGNKLMESGL
ncbi:hypothetical protein OOZ15_02165 [Galbibacter sp. EGI 63066]|nr:hypothetical protein [Galbibacter sp. EGI 63066]